MEGESSFTRRIIDELHSSEIQGVQEERESGVTRSIIDELHSSDIVKRKVKVVLLEESLMNFILGICNEIKWKMKVMLLEVFDELHASDIQGDQMDGESGVTRSIIDELHSSDI